ncbi:MAG: hypothetical protein JO194_08595 [Candidatus Eremiobacteraeota bacterium]|nr:hypothetical protein [Candidatus Eremiobacteraeota bacterium]
MVFQSMSRAARLGAGLVTLIAALAFAAGCGGSSYGGGGGGGGGACGGIYGPACPTPTPVAAADCSVSPAGNVTIDLNFGLAACVDKTYGSVLGFSTDNTHSQIIKIAAGSTVTFMATAQGPHTADELGSGGFPANDTNPATASAAGTDISAANFSTGTLNNGQSSAIYNAAVVGIYYFGCHFHYGSGMRTVLIVH